MTTPAQEHVLDWLRDAHAMEEQAEQMLRAQSDRLKHYPDLKRRIDEHIVETKEQQRLVESCIHRLGGSTSAMKDIAARILAFGQGLGSMAVSDEVVKGAMAGYIFEHLEIAAYTSLRTAAEHCGDAETVRVCDFILPQERAMAAWLAEHLPSITITFLTRSETPGIEAKR
ncbi:ferritin-like domain-containing protein [Ralstonia soli]|uniref:Ferritin-like domain-containing protein n=1 Tax=Ralstonia soli TaxID=2953896 RepID=A0ABT1AM50_9RALS|nr:ferritin-like domain-containing protein [Ralstonia soli]MCO5399192.1 ferritin-like domain-containing protein [Ralstonia soli]